MELTEGNKEFIDGLSYEHLLEQWRFSPAGNPWFQGETGEYWGKRMAELKSKLPDGGVGASKRVGWEK